MFELWIEVQICFVYFNIIVKFIVIKFLFMYFIDFVKIFGRDVKFLFKGLYGFEFDEDDVIVLVCFFFGIFNVVELDEIFLQEIV